MRLPWSPKDVNLAHISDTDREWFEILEKIQAYAPDRWRYAGTIPKTLYTTESEGGKLIQLSRVAPRDVGHTIPSSGYSIEIEGRLRLFDIDRRADREKAWTPMVITTDWEGCYSRSSVHPACGGILESIFERLKKDPRI